MDSFERVAVIRKLTDRCFSNDILLIGKGGPGLTLNCSREPVKIYILGF